MDSFSTIFNNTGRKGRRVGETPAMHAISFAHLMQVPYLVGEVVKLLDKKGFLP